MPPLSNKVPADPNAATPYRGFIDTTHGWNIFGDIAGSLTSGGGTQTTDSPDQAQLREGAQHFSGLSGQAWAKLSPEDQAQHIWNYINDPSTPTFSSDTFSHVKTAETKAGQIPPTPRSQADATAAYEHQIASGPWAQLGQALVSQYQQAETPTLNLVSGAAAPGAEAGAASSALASLGLAPNSSAGSWLSSQMKAADATAAPVDAAMRAEGAQYAAEAGPISKALADYGQANELALATAPENAWLSALASHVTSNLSYYGTIPTAAVQSLEADPAVITALQQSGGYGGSTTGLTPLSSLKTPGITGGSSPLPKLTNVSGLTGSVPAAGTSPGQ